MAEEDLSLIEKPRDYSEIAKLQEPGVLEQFLDEPAIAIIEAVTGAFALGKTGLLVSGGKLVQALLKAQLYKQFAHEFNRFRSAGKLPDSFGDSKYGFQTWTELMAIIDSECPDADRIEALKAMFFAVNRVNIADEERILAYQLWQISKQLNSGELILLKTLNEHHPHLGGIEYNDWMAIVGKHSGLQINQLVEVHLKRLTELLLAYPVREGTKSGSRGSVTTLGMRFCQNIRTYQRELRECEELSEQ